MLEKDIHDEKAKQLLLKFEMVKYYSGKNLNNPFFTLFMMYQWRISYLKYCFM